MFLAEKNTGNVRSSVVDMDSFVITPDLVNNPVMSSGGSAAVRDPSNIIKVGSTYYCYVTYVLNTESEYPNGYQGTIYVFSSPDLVTWTLGSKVVDKGASGDDDETGCFTPSIFAEGGTYYLVYTGVDGTFNFPTVVPKVLLIATATNPAGPFTKQGTIITDFDGGDWKTKEGGLDDASMIKVDNEYRIYHSGTSTAVPEKRTGYAYATNPLGPYTDYESNPVISAPISYTTVESPTVFIHNGNYHAFIDLFDGATTQDIGHWISSDGIDWSYQGTIITTNTELNCTATLYAPATFEEGGYAKRLLFMFTPTVGAMTIGIAKLSHGVTLL